MKRVHRVLRGQAHLRRAGAAVMKQGGSGAEAAGVCAAACAHGVLGG